jgi:hypothetical protein
MQPRGRTVSREHNFAELARAILAKSLHHKKLAAVLRRVFHDGRASGFNEGAKWMMQNIRESAATFTRARPDASVETVLDEVTKRWR